MTGDIISHYEVLEKIGSGGMGVVFKARDLKLGRTVALKFLSEHLARDRGAIDRFEREARAASALNHPGICTIHEIEEVDGRVFLAMELLEGISLKERLHSGPLPFKDVLDYAVQIADALQAAHAKGICHRDIKPQVLPASVLPLTLRQDTPAPRRSTLELLNHFDIFFLGNVTLNKDCNHGNNYDI